MYGRGEGARMSTKLNCILIMFLFDRGFKKVTHYNLPEPIVVLRNSLFQRDNPHLVHHMMMDRYVPTW